jgi:hypothetical protein
MILRPSKSWLSSTTFAASQGSVERADSNAARAALAVSTGLLSTEMLRAHPAPRPRPRHRHRLPELAKENARIVSCGCLPHSCHLGERKVYAALTEHRLPAYWGGWSRYFPNCFFYLCCAGTVVYLHGVGESKVKRTSVVWQ